MRFYALFFVLIHLVKWGKYVEHIGNVVMCNVFLLQSSVIVCGME